MDRAHPLLPFIATLVGVGVFSLMDALMKGAAIAVGAFIALLLRSLVGWVIATPLWLTTRKVWPSRTAMRLHLLRGVVGSAMAFTFFWGIARLPLAEAIALSFTAPLVAPWFLSWPDASAALEIAGAAVLAVSGAMVLSWAYRRAEAQALVPLEYTGFLWAGLFGWLFFREPLTLPTLLGAALIVVGCWIAAPRKRPEQSAA